MEPTILPHDYILTARIRENGGMPERGDIIVFKIKGLVNGKARQSYEVKRVIGLPGDVIVIIPEIPEDSGGSKRHRFIEPGVYVNGRRLLEPYIKENPRYLYGPALVPENGVFVLGDNRNKSWDSSYTNLAVPIENIVGRVIFRYYPLSRIGFIE